MIKVVITGGKGRQLVALDKRGVNGVSGQQLVTRHQALRSLQDSLVYGKDPQKGKQGKWLMKIHLLHHRTVALEIAQHPFGRNLFVFNDPGAKINEQSF